MHPALLAAPMASHMCCWGEGIKQSLPGEDLHFPCAVCHTSHGRIFAYGNDRLTLLRKVLLIFILSQYGVVGRVSQGSSTCSAFVALCSQHSTQTGILVHNKPQNNLRTPQLRSPLSPQEQHTWLGCNNGYRYERRQVDTTGCAGTPSVGQRMELISKKHHPHCRLQRSSCSVLGKTEWHRKEMRGKRPPHPPCASKPSCTVFHVWYLGRNNATHPHGRQTVGQRHHQTSEVRMLSSSRSKGNAFSLGCCGSERCRRR